MTEMKDGLTNIERSLIRLAKLTAELSREWEAMLGENEVLRKRCEQLEQHKKDLLQEQEE